MGLASWNFEMTLNEIPADHVATCASFHMAAQKQHFTGWTPCGADRTGPARFITQRLDWTESCPAASVTTSSPANYYSRNNKTCSIVDARLKSGADGDLRWY